MPIDAQAYMAGAIPGLSRGGSWGTPTAPHGGDAASTHSGGQAGAGGAPPSHTNPLLGTPAAMFDPLMIGRMAAFGSAASMAGGTGMQARTYVHSHRALSTAGPRSPLARSVTTPGTREEGDYFSQSHRSGMERQRRQPSHRQPSAASGSGHRASHVGTLAVSPVRYDGWSGESAAAGAESPSGKSSVSSLRSPSVSTEHYRPLDRRRRESDEWESHSGALHNIPPEPIYRPIPDPRRAKADSLPEPPSEHGRVLLRAERDYRSRTQPSAPPPRPSAMRSPSADRLRACLSPKTVRIASIPEEVPRPAMLRRHTATESTAGRRETLAPTAAPPVTPMRSVSAHPSSTAPREDQRRPHLVRSLSHDTFSLRELAEALPFATPRPGNVSPLLLQDEYDRYAPHPAVESPTAPRAPPSHRRNDSGSELVRTADSHTGPATPTMEYLPPGFPRSTRDTPTQRDGPALKTHGVPWHEQVDAESLPLTPDGPQWVQARPPRHSGAQEW